MSRTAQKNRRAKRDVITIDEDGTSGQPTVKSSRIEAEPVSSPEVLQLQQKVAELQQTVTELERNFQGACRMARESQLRVQFLENLIDTKPQVGVQNKERENELVKTVNQLKNELDKERKGASEQRLRDRARIDDLTSKLAQFEAWLQHAPGMQQLPQLRQTEVITVDGDESGIEQSGEDSEEREERDPEDDDEASEEQPDTALEPRDTGDSSNIFQLCEPGSKESISLGGAICQLRAKFDECGEEKWNRHVEKMEDVNVACEVCQKTPSVDQTLPHFLSTGHIRKVRERGAAVSFTAFVHWLYELQEAAAAPAADAASSSSATEECMEKGSDC